jgi:DNA-directed RNA polymerase specialized sigma24 family protein
MTNDTGVIDPRTISSLGFENLLRSLDANRDRAGEKYEAMRQRLIKFFARKGCFPAENPADETFDRVARRLETLEIHNIDAFVWGVAKNVMLESRRGPQIISLEKLSFSEGPRTEHAESAIIHHEESRRRLKCLDGYIRELRPADRELLLAYDYCERRPEEKAELAQRLGLSQEGMRTRAHRIKHRARRAILGGRHTRRLKVSSPGYGPRQTRELRGIRREGARANANTRTKAKLNGVWPEQAACRGSTLPGINPRFRADFRGYRFASAGCPVLQPGYASGESGADQGG